MHHYHPAGSANGIEIAEQFAVSSTIYISLEVCSYSYSYGVSRVFSQQCGYVLSDAQIAQSNMRALLKAVRTSELDLNAGKAR